MTNLTKKREEKIAKLRELCEAYYWDFVGQGDDLMEAVDACLQSYGALVEQETREKVIEEVESIIIDNDGYLRRDTDVASSILTFCNQWYKQTHTIRQHLSSKPKEERVVTPHKPIDCNCFCHGVNLSLSQGCPHCKPTRYDLSQLANKDKPKEEGKK